MLRPRKKPRKRSLCSSKPLRIKPKSGGVFATRPNRIARLLRRSSSSLAGHLNDKPHRVRLCHDPPPDTAIKELPETKGHASNHVQTRPMRSAKPAAHKRRRSPRRRQQWRQIRRRRTPNPTGNSRRMIKGLTPKLTITPKQKMLTSNHQNVKPDNVVFDWLKVSRHLGEVRSYGWWEIDHSDARRPADDPQRGASETSLSSTST